MRAVALALSTAALCLVVTACASDEGAKKPDETAAAEPASSTPAAEATTVYYAGTVQVSSPDGATPYGPPSAGAASRQLDPAAGKMTEVVFDDGRLRSTDLVREPGSSVFDASDDEGSFHGKLAFEGDEWAWSGWSYDITMKDGSKLDGHAETTADGFTAQKTFKSPDGTPRVRITETWKKVSKEEWEALVQRLTEEAKAKAAAEAAGGGEAAGGEG